MSYLTRKKQLSHSPELAEIMSSSAQVWNTITTWFWRIVRRQNKWLDKSQIQKWLCKSSSFPGLSAQSIQAVADQFFNALMSWSRNRKRKSNTRPPHKQKTTNKVIWKSQSIRLKDGKLVLSRGRGFEPLCFDWDHPKPKRVELVQRSGSYYLCCQYKAKPKDQTTGNKVAGIDLGEKHLAAIFIDGQQPFLLNGGEYRAKQQYREKLKAKFQRLLSKKQKGSNSWCKLVESKNDQLSSLRNQIKDLLHKLSRKLVDTCLERDVSTLVIGDVRDIRGDMNLGSRMNQRLHQWVHGTFRHMISYKAKLVGMAVELQNEAYTSQTCPKCGHRYKPSGRNYDCSECDFEGHRDVVGAMNIRKKYVESDMTRLIGDMAPPIGVRFESHLQCRSSSRRKTSFEAAMS